MKYGERAICMDCKSEKVKVHGHNRCYQCHKKANPDKVKKSRKR